MQASFIGEGGNSAITFAEEDCVHEFGGHLVAFTVASPGVLAALKAVLYSCSRDVPAASAPTRVRALSGRDGWQLEVDGSIVRGLALRTPLPLVAEEMIATACLAVASKTSGFLLNGVLLEKDGAAIALVGDDLDSTKVLGLHLHGRGWAAVAFAYGFVSETSLEVVGQPALVSVSSTAIDQIPPRYRPAIEASLWYDAGFDLTFYTVDPLSIHRRSISSAVLTHVVVVDGELEDSPSLSTDLEAAEIGPLGSHVMIGSVRIARLTLGTPIASCGAVERWVWGFPV